MTQKSRLHLGAAYYYEYPALGEQPHPDRLATDMRQMREAGLTLIRVGESVWSTWEPRDGEFDLDWLEPVLDAAHEAGIDVILGTPTYALPMWLAKKHPEINGDKATGEPIGWGARQEMDFTHPAFREHAERVIRAVVGRYAGHPSIVGYQVDNEPGLRLLYNDGIFAAFVEWLRERYGTVERLNDEWGLVYWSHRLTDWSELWLPEGNFQPQYHLAWRRFQAHLVDDYIAWQADLVRSLVVPAAQAQGKQAPFVTTCISYEQAAVEDASLSKSLDVASCNVYYSSQDGLAFPSSAELTPDWIANGTWGLYGLADLAWSSKQAGFWVTETNAGGIGQSAYNIPPYDGQLRQVTWALVSRGAQAVEYWHWHTLHYGAETYWIGVVPHDEQPGRVHAEVARIGRDFEAVGDLFEGATPDADVAFLYSSDAKWALSAFTLGQPLGSARMDPNPEAYRQLAMPFYRAAFDAGLQTQLVRPAQVVGADALVGSPSAFASVRPVLVMAADFTASDALLAWVREYAEAGGHLVLGPRSAYGDEEARARSSVKPATLAEVAGVSYQEFQSLEAPVALAAAEGGPLAGVADGSASLWAEYLRPEGAEVLATYDHPHLSRFAAVTSRAVGAGRITVVGTVPDQQTAAALMAWAVGERAGVGAAAAAAPIAGSWTDLPASVRVTSSTLVDGRRAWFLHHWGWGKASVTAPIDVADAVSGEALAAGAVVELGAWDVRVLVSVAG
ncbi:beta-galactosidase [Demequina sp. NBRC 110056]|uniref:beta-galactosidase n=1 Tax=Demequina sp. NBRC 110056 TaxID=1570345 RepID=UPI000A0259A2|nr:beta-galactosidase [Demequina sp. NBRC 110056]